jgi:hypothetical protein
MSTGAPVARIHGITKSQAIDQMKGMTDPVSIRMVQELIEFAYSRSPKMGFEKMQKELLDMCMAKRIFVQ